ncbi:unnamed protein product [Cuscuta campestris]|uniref:Hydrophobic protein OSR8 n=1 Tax=Cuscuta campestris TaxID=132261 RepID=A0A484KGS5_9ASTE|nr:unnamed protein product [Cuscuta campestris]
MEGCEMFLEILVAILLPPLGVFFRHGCCSCELLICLILTLLGYVPGIVYAIYAIVVRHGGHEQDDDLHQWRRPLNA